MSGGQGGAGWSRINLGRATALLDYLEGVPGAKRVEYAAELAWGPDGVTSASSNHDAEAWGNELVRAAVCGTPDQLKAASATVVVGYFPRELAIGSRGVGLWADEQGCPDPHGGQHLVGTSMTRLAAVITGDRGLLDWTGQLMRAAARALRAVATPDLQVWTVGFRDAGNLVPLSGVATAWLRQVRRDVDHVQQISELAGKNAARNWVDPMFVAVRALRYLQDHLHDDLGGAPSEPIGPTTLKFAQTAYRGHDAHLVVLPKQDRMPGVEVCDWVLVPYLPKPDLQRTGPAVRWGNNWQTPPPAPPPGSYAIQFPGRAS